MSSMRRSATYTLAALLAAALALWGAGRFSPVGRTKVYFTLERAWKAHWPFSRGQYLLSRAEPAFDPLVPVRVEVEPGVNMLLDPEDYVSRTLLETGQWEADSWAIVKQHLPPGGTFVDVGAHIGIYSLKAARVVGSQGRVISIEPNPDTLQKLRDNIQASGDTNVAVQPFACSDAETDLDLFAAARANTGGTSLSRANAEQVGAVSAVYHVHARPLDAILEAAGVSGVDVIKIDVEGAEMLVLKGARQTLARYSPVISVELIDRQLKSMGTSAAEVTEFLRSQGYTPRQMIDANVIFAK